jgi:hypothetical protein
MANSHPLEISPDVRALLPDEVVSRLRTDPGYEVVQCGECGKPIKRGAPMAVIVLHDPDLDMRHQYFAHMMCSASKVVQADLTRLVRPPEGHNLQVSAGLAAFAGQPRPLLIVEPTMQFDGVAENGEITDLMVKGVLDQGLHLLPRVLDIFELPRVESWDASVTPLGGAEYGLGLYAHGSEVFTGNALAPGPEWEAQIRAGLGLAVYVGTSMETPTGGRGHAPAVLDRLAAAGRLAGAVIPASILA